MTTGLGLIRLNWTKVGLKDYVAVDYGTSNPSLNWTKVGLKVFIHMI